MEAKVNELVADPVAPLHGNASKPGRFLGIPYSVSFDCDGSVRRDGHITVQGEGDEVHIEVPLSFSVTARAGEGSRQAIKIARHILGGLQDTASGKLTVLGDLRLTLNADWTPTLTLSTDFKWHEPPHFYVFGVPVTFADKAGPPVRKALNQLEEQAASLIDPSKIRQEAVKAWKSLQQPIQVSKVPECWLALRPLSAAFTGVSSANNILRASLSATVDSSLVLGGKPHVGVPTELPPLGTLAPDAPKEFTVQIPIILTYTGIRETVLSIVPLDQPIEFQVNGRQGHVTIKALEIYPSGGRIVLGLQIRADVPGRWLDVNGWFWLLAMPKIDADRRVVHFEHFALARQTDNLSFRNSPPRRSRSRE